MTWEIVGPFVSLEAQRNFPRGGGWLTYGKSKEEKNEEKIPKTTRVTTMAC